MHSNNKFYLLTVTKVFQLQLRTLRSLWFYCSQCRSQPKLRWLDDAEDDIKALGIWQWRIKAQDRNEWMAIKREAKVKLKGPWSHRRRRSAGLNSILTISLSMVTWRACVFWDCIFARNLTLEGHFHWRSRSASYSPDIDLSGFWVLQKNTNSLPCTQSQSFKNMLNTSIYQWGKKKKPK
jgi:hypothetical protein